MQVGLDRQTLAFQHRLQSRGLQHQILQRFQNWLPLAERNSVPEQPGGLQPCLHPHPQSEPLSHAFPVCMFLFLQASTSGTQASSTAYWLFCGPFCGPFLRPFAQEPVCSSSHAGYDSSVHSTQCFLTLVSHSQSVSHSRIQVHAYTVKVKFTPLWPLFHSEAVPFNGQDNGGCSALSQTASPTLWSMIHNQGKGCSIVSTCTDLSADFFSGNVSCGAGGGESLEEAHRGIRLYRLCLPHALMEKNLQMLMHTTQ